VTAVGSSTSVAATGAALGPGARSVGALGRAPLPSPGIVGPADYQDASILLLQADVMQSSMNKVLGQGQVERNREAIKTYRKKEAEAVAAQEKAERESHGFWAKLKKFAGTVAKVAAVVAAVAGSVFTGGTSLVAVAAIVAAGLSAGAMVVKETHMFGKLSDKIGMGMEIASAVIGVAACGAGALGAGEQAAAETPTWAKVTVAGAEATGAAATATGAGAGCVVAGYQHDADEAAADGEDARGRMQMKQSEQQTVIDWLKQVSQYEADATDATIKTIDGCNQAAKIAIAGVRA
jgi:hypothetical protein